MILFPGVPRDGVQPLEGMDSPAPTRENGSYGAHRPAFEAGDFWDSGDTQEFVGVAGSPSSTATAVLPEATSTSTPESDDGLTQLDPASYRAVDRGDLERRVVHRRRHRRAVVLAPILLIAVSIPVVMVLLRSTSSHGARSYAAANLSKRSTATVRSPSTSGKPARAEHRRAPRRRSQSARRHAYSAPKIVQTRYTAPVTTHYTDSTASSGGTTYQPQAVAARSDSNSSSAAPAQAAGPVGPGALTGAGSTPSG